MQIVRFQWLCPFLTARAPKILLLLLLIVPSISVLSFSIVAPQSSLHHSNQVRKKNQSESEIENQNENQNELLREKKQSHSFFSEYFLDRNVTIKQVSCLERQSDSDMLPLQIYQGVAVPPKRRSPIPNVLDLTSTANETRKGNTDLSLSAITLLQKYDQLSEREKSQLENKIQAEAKASAPLDLTTDLHILYLDDHICVTSKPSGVLSVPGPRRNPSLAGLVYDLIQPTSIDIDQMVVHRLDMDTSGILVYALTEQALRQLHIDFRERNVHKVYEALLVGHFCSASEVDIDVALERDPFHPPFMRAAQPKDHVEINAVHQTFQKFIEQAPKPSQTELQVLSLEHLPNGLNVTRVRLIPKTGRTHQLRVHCSCLGYPIVGDDIYGYNGAGNCGIAFNDLNSNERLQLHREIHKQGYALCLHAKQLCFHHPITRTPLIFEAATPF